MRILNFEWNLSFAVREGKGNLVIIALHYLSLHDIKKG
jgi:hypothetical protein